MTEPETARLLAVIALAYPSFEVTRERVALWHDMMKGIDCEMAQQAVRVHVAESKWAPTVAEILDEARTFAFGPQLEAVDVWHQLIGAIRTYGNYRLNEAREALPAPVMQAIDYLGGWERVCMSENVDMLRAHFLRMWETIAAREKRAEVLQLAAGEYEPPAIGSGAGRHLRGIEGGRS